MEEPTKKEIEELKKKSAEYASSQGFKLNSKGKIINFVINGLLKNKKEKGELYCPCRRVTGNKEKDREIICPCIFHRKEIELQGSCHCKLFVK